LAAMAARLTIGKKKYADVEARMREIAAQADDLRASLERAVELDAQAFDAVMDAYKLPKDTDAEKAEREEAVEVATHGAAHVPLDVCRQVTDVLELLAEVAETGNVNSVTDAASGAAMGVAAFMAASMNVHANAAGVRDKVAAHVWLNALAELRARMQAAEERVHQALKERAKLEV
ncbi:cyclodeaminase/cyclohydrolase family protein, partial [Anaerolineae bacterium CFX8]|nr:cyclodeaminase/cyclohydrolase family protein [Anaerolineae bacterium CFX8]